MVQRVGGLPTTSYPGALVAIGALSLIWYCHVLDYKLNRFLATQVIAV
jgi:hypothetical protein